MITYYFNWRPYEGEDGRGNIDVTKYDDDVVVGYINFGDCTMTQLGEVYDKEGVAEREETLITDFLIAFPVGKDMGDYTATAEEMKQVVEKFFSK